ncbi:DivIVA domain-containing protein [Nonomuraea sp. NPDC003804]|uniref:DivIVA domain-containing protein n=1 Tax=Nonomuraea sp. NPDC003804 TaxID=3154547 RepID=UPI0033A0BA55
MAKYEAHGGALKAGFWVLGIGAVLLLVGFVASFHAENPTCGGERMESGDWCSSRRSGPSSTEEKQSENAAVSFWALRGGALFVVVGGGLLIGERATRGLRAKLETARWQREEAARRARPPVSADQLVREIRAVEFPRVQSRGYMPELVDGILDQVVARLKAGEPDWARTELVQRYSLTRLGSAPGYDPVAVDAFLNQVDELLRGRVV